LHSAVDLLATYAGRPTDLQGWLKDAMVTHDKDMRLQYLAGMSLNLYQANDIYQDMVKYGPFMPREMFTGSDVHFAASGESDSPGNESLIFQSEQ